jgi:hypothetical protein
MGADYVFVWMHFYFLLKYLTSVGNTYGRGGATIHVCWAAGEMAIRAGDRAGSRAEKVVGSHHSRDASVRPFAAVNIELKKVLNLIIFQSRLRVYFYLCVTLLWTSCEQPRPIETHA